MECVTLYAAGHGILQLLRILFAWPAVFLAGVVLLVWRFKPAVDAILAAIAKVVVDGRNKLKVGPVSIDMNGTQRGSLKGTAEAAEALAPVAEGADGAPKTSDEAADVEALRAEVANWREAAADNAINYLELLLAPKTKAFLYMLAANPVQDFDAFFRFIDLISASGAEAEAIRRVLVDNEFVIFDNGKARATGTLTNWIALRESKGFPVPHDYWTFVRPERLNEMTAGEYVSQGGSDGAA